MDGRFLAEQPEKIVFTLKLTASAEEWEQLRDQLSEKWPSATLGYMITNLLAQARKTFYEEKHAN